MAAATNGALTTDARDRLRQHFIDDRTPNRWNDLWKEGSFLPWDRGTPNPALGDTLAKTALVGSPLRSDGSRRRAFVPGCGKGYDVHVLAAHGFDAYGLEAAEDAILAARKFAGEVEERGEYAALDSRVGKGKVEFVFGDFYNDDWEGGVGGGKFDLIYDYTVSFLRCSLTLSEWLMERVKFLCAMPPNLRPAWSKRMTELLAPGGVLVCVEFPTYKEPNTGGPPWAVKPEMYEMLLPFPGEEPLYDAEGYILKQEDRAPNPNGLQKIAHWKAERSHPAGQGTDNVGLWKHKGGVAGA